MQDFTTALVWDGVKLILAIVLLFFFPIGTIISIAIFIHLKRSGERAQKAFDDAQTKKQHQEELQKALEKEAARKTKYGAWVEALQQSEQQAELNQKQSEQAQFQSQKEKIKSQFAEMISYLEGEAQEINALPKLTCDTFFSEEEPIAFKFKIRHGYQSLSLNLTAAGQFTADSAALGSLTANPDLPDPHDVSEEAKQKLETLFAMALQEMDVI